MAKPEIIIADYLLHNTDWNLDKCIVTGQNIWNEVSKKTSVTSELKTDSSLSELQVSPKKSVKNTKFSPIEDENTFVRENFNIEKIISFSNKNSLEVIRGGDYQYQLWINGKGAYAVSLTFLYTLVHGISMYEKEKLSKDD